ncbi:hypothetical protein HOM13_01660 [Candidatus Woesearchaeota archaeon]|jgi:hypothetical protein|nr:hypothetical protein [Candidatus Woesearchaeota archaeon]
MILGKEISIKKKLKNIVLTTTVTAGILLPTYAFVQHIEVNELRDEAYHVFLREGYVPRERVDFITGDKYNYPEDQDLIFKRGEGIVPLNREYIALRKEIISKEQTRNSIMGGLIAILGLGLTGGYLYEKISKRGKSQQFQSDPPEHL